MAQMVMNDEVQITAARLSMMIDPLFSYTYIQRDIKAEDKRPSVLHLTDKVRMFLTVIATPWRDADEIFLATPCFDMLMER